MANAGVVSDGQLLPAQNIPLRAPPLMAFPPANDLRLVPMALFLLDLLLMVRNGCRNGCRSWRIGVRPAFRPAENWPLPWKSLLARCAVWESVESLTFRPLLAKLGARRP